MRNIFLLCVVFFWGLSLAGCASSNPVYIAPTEGGGQLYFLRPVSWKLDNAVVQGLDLDLTLALQGEDFMQAPVMNYTLRLPVQEASLADKVVVRLSMDHVVVECSEHQRLYKSLDGDSHVMIRYSVKLDQDSLLAVLKGEASCAVQVEIPGGGIESLESKEFSEGIRNLRVLVS